MGESSSFSKVDHHGQATFPRKVRLVRHLHTALLRAWLRDTVGCLCGALSKGPGGASTVR